MKQLPVAGKALSLIFAAIFVAGCASNDTSEADAAAAAAAEEEARRVAEQQAESEAMSATKALQDAVAAAGNVVYFEFDSSTLTAASRDILDAHIALKKAGSGDVRLEGHTDERGTREYNIALGERRGKAVMDYMVVNGIASYRVETVSYGEERPVAYGSGEANWSQNRRVELK
jgi:peptidoglycan-associated lipoprotein